MTSPLNHSKTEEIFRTNKYYCLGQENVFMFQQGTMPNFCLVDGRLTIIEYSDLPDELAEMLNRDGSLTFKLVSIAVHIISRTFVEKLNSDGFSLPLHRAIKKIPHIDNNSEPVKPAKQNGVKLETFVFDAVPLASKSIILRHPALKNLHRQKMPPVLTALKPQEKW